MKGAGGGGVNRTGEGGWLELRVNLVTSPHGSIIWPSSWPMMIFRLQGCAFEKEGSPSRKCGGDLHPQPLVPESAFVPRTKSLMIKRMASFPMRLEYKDET